MPYTIFIIDDNLVDTFFEIVLKVSKPCFKETFYKIENDQELSNVIFDTKRNQNSSKYIKIINPERINALALQTFLAMAEFNRIYIFLNRIPQGLEIKGHVYKISDKIFENSLMLEDTGYYIKSLSQQ